MIPKIIHQIWLGPKPAPTRLFNTWKETHPDFEYILWTENNLPKLIGQAQFDAAARYNTKSDILRFQVLYNMGGVYVDADSYCLKPIHALMHTNFTAYEPCPGKPRVAAGTIGITPKHILMRFCLQEVASAPLQKYYHYDVLGPGTLIRAIQKLEGIKIYPADLFYPYYYTDIKKMLKTGNVIEKNLRESYAVQFWLGTINGYDKVDKICKILNLP